MTKQEEKEIVEAIKKKYTSWDKDPLAMSFGGGIYNMGLRDAVKVIRSKSKSSKELRKAIAEKRGKV